MHFMFLVSFFKPVVLDVFRRFLIFNEYIVLIFFPGVFISEQSAYNVGSGLLAFYSFSQFQVQCLKYEFMPIIGRKKNENPKLEKVGKLRTYFVSQKAF